MGAGHASRENGKRGGRPKGPSAKTQAIRQALRQDRELTAAATLEEIRRGMRFDVRRLWDEQGNFKRITDLTEEEAAMIAAIDVVKRNITAGDGQVDTVLKIKLVDRAKYIEMSAKHHGLLTERVEHGGEIMIKHELPD